MRRDTSTYVIRGGWLVVTIALGILRLAGTQDNRFQALAHLVVGGFFGAYALGRSANARCRGEHIDVDFYLALGLGLTVLEAIAFLSGNGRIDGR